jgi:V/A-type H+-transporting ATPase subunit A
LAYKRHFPSINWLNSYSLYTENISDFWAKEVAEDFAENRSQAMTLLQEESKLEEIVKLVGMEALSNRERLVLLVAKSVREDFLFQNAFDAEDAYTPLKKQYGILKSILAIYKAGLKVISGEDFEFKNLQALPVLQEVAKAKDLKESAEFEALAQKVESEISNLK